MPRISAIASTFAIIQSLTLSVHARAEAAHAALIVGNATYSSLPGVPACAKSANTVAAALRAQGFQVTERQDASTGGIDAGISEFSQHLAGAGNAGFVYICGYAADFNDRIFLLPASARLDRPSDVLTQGVLAKSMLASVTHDPATLGVVVFDMIPKPDGPPRLALDALTGLPVPDGVGIVAAAQPTPPDAPTPLATALVAALSGPAVATDGLLSAVRAQLAGGSVTALAIHMPTHPGLLVGAAPAVVPSPAPSAAPVSAPIVARPSTPPVAAAPLEQLPDEAQMTDPDRRKVQTALVRLGYYDNPVDGLFGPETRAAIRRYQHEIGTEMTGRLSADQATRLVNTH